MVVYASTRDGIVAAWSVPPDVVLVDLSIPVEDGFALLRQLRADHNPAVRRLPVVSTAHAHPKDREQCLASGFDAYEAKPVDMNHTSALVADLVSRPPDTA
jgi:CheY-like chemotaxis protein